MTKDNVEKTKKDETYWKVLNSALELEMKKGHMKWTVSELSRKSKVTRSLIYYYFGRTKQNLIDAAIEIIATDFAGLSERRMEMWRQGKLAESLLEAREIHDKAPHLCLYYMMFRNHSNAVGEMLRKKEYEFREKIKILAPNADESQLRSIFAIYFGLAYAPNVGLEEIQICMNLLNEQLTKLRA